LGAGTPGLGQNSAAGTATGGAGGGGYWAGSAGTSGKSGTGGSGGTNYGKAIDSGTSTAPGGLTLDSYPKQNAGYAGNPGAAVISIYKSFSLAIKNSNQWKRADRAWVKISGQWREIYNGWTKVNGVWKEIAHSSGPVAAEPTYQLTADRAAVDEGSTVEFRLTTTGVPVGTQIAYSATGIAASDLTSGELSGSFIVGSRETISFGIRANQITNGPRTLTVVLDGSLAIGSCVINDTSQTPTYAISPNTTAVDEGGSVTWAITTTNFGSGTLYWTNIGSTNANDFTDGTNSGAITITNNSGVLTKTLASDLITEGSENIRIQLRTGSITGSIVATSALVTVNDTSTSPPTYQLSNSVASVDEGGTVMFTLVTQNVSDGTQVPYTISGAGIASDDFDSMQVNGHIIGRDLNGYFIIQNGVSTLRVVVSADRFREGSEIFTVSLDNGQASVSVTILDTSQEIVISANTKNVNLFTLADSLYRQNIKFRVAAGVVVGSTSTAVPAMTVGNFPAGSVIDLFIEAGAYIVGAGGNGGPGYGGSGSRGLPGGPAISGSANVTMNLTNNGTIGGGGGGGAGGAVWPGHLDMTGPANGDPNGGPGRSGGGGGGGAGSVSGSGGTPRYTNIPSQYGSPGTLTLGGAAGTGHCRAGAGGNLGNPGANSGNCDAQPGATGGAAGNAMVLNGMTINNIVRGTILGNVV
jgi:hypothetical protein